MNRYRIMIVGLLVLAVVLVVITLMPSKSVPSEAVKRRSVASAKEKGRASSKVAVKVASKKPGSVNKAVVLKPKGPTAAASEPEGEVDQEAKAAKAVERRQKMVAVWEKTVDQIVEQKDVLPEEQSLRVKEAFDALDKEDQMDGIRRSLNLFPDDQFPALYGILFDKSEDAEVLDAIFSDALNRPEELKNPLMKELVKDKEHPCFFESARILDVIGELNVQPASASSP